jgi:glycine/D-amino acid oxidase-like deaminating enzyme/nitrite reductase/ring-hydroxylating ferredoxin subunit
MRKNASPYDNAPLWRENLADPSFYPALMADVSVDCCIIGAGIAGLSTAYMLAREGRSVVVLDSHAVGAGESGRTTAHLSSALDDRYYELEVLHGPEGARLAAQSHSAAIDTIEKIADAEGIDCDFERLNGYLFAPPMADRDELELEWQAAQRAGIQVQWVARAPIQSFHTGPSLRFPGQAQFHPLKYLQGLARAITRYGGKVFGGTHVTDVGSSSPVLVRTKGGPVVRAERAVIATNAPISETYGLYTVNAPHRTYVVAARVPRGYCERALFWDTPDPYHYIRLVKSERGDSDLLVIGGEDHKTGQAHNFDERFECLEEWTRERFPEIESFEYRWSGQIMEPVDGLAFIGEHPAGRRSVYLASGDSGHGMTHGTIAGLVLRDLMLGQQNPWSHLYDPSRITLRAFTSLIHQNINVGAQFTDWLQDADVASIDQIAPGQGATIQTGWVKLAVYRDEKGSYHQRSAVCPHLGCIVSWNSMQKSWDCPCHGSRFDAYGNVANGPASSSLDLPENYQALLKAAALLLESSASLSANFLGKLFSLGLRVGSK